MLLTHTVLQTTAQHTQTTKCSVELSSCRLHQQLIN